MTFVGRQSVAGCALVLALLVPAWESVSSVQRGLHYWQRLRLEHKTQPDVREDAYYRELGAYLPTGGPIGLVQLGPGTPDDRLRTHYFLQYSLAPRQIVASAEPRFVIVTGAPRGVAFGDGRFELIKSLGDYVSVFRRIE